jgi:hypothetical protein
MVVASEFLSLAQATQIINNVDNDPNFKSSMGLSAEDARQLKGLSVEANDNDARTKTDETFSYTIVAIVSDSSVLNKVQTRLINFLENVNFVKLRVNEARKGYESLITNINREVAELDSSGKNAISSGALNENSNTVFDPAAMRVHMYQEKVKIETDLALLKGVEVIDGFRPSKPIFPKLSQMIPASVLGSFLLAVLFIGIRYFQKIVAEYPE